MKHMIWTIGLALALGTTPAAAQTRVSVAVGFGVPRPFVHGVVVVWRPYFYRYRHRRSLFVRRVYTGRYQHRHHWDEDDAY